METIHHETGTLVVSSVLRIWRASLLTRKLEILKEEKKKEKQEKTNSEDSGVKGSNPGETDGTKYFFGLGKLYKKNNPKLKERTNDLKMLSLIKISIGNKWDLKEIQEISSIRDFVKGDFHHLSWGILTQYLF